MKTKYKKIIRQIVVSTRKNYRTLDKALDNNRDGFNNAILIDRLQKASKHLKAATALVLDGLYENNNDI